MTTQIVRSWREGQPVTKLRFTTYLLHNVLSAVVWRVTAELEGTRSRCRVEGLIAKKLLFERHDERYASDMATIVEIEKLALNLPEKERATLAANLLESLPGVLSDEDEGVAEACVAVAELEANPDQAISLARLDALSPATIRAHRGPRGGNESKEKRRDEHERLSVSLSVAFLLSLLAEWTRLT
ncbi:MAG TPA: hypothetical protein VJH03_02110 [Blastocatellia bacterium]|nr:hypothetical protein [Blastocatellia bacterium]